MRGVAAEAGRGQGGEGVGQGADAGGEFLRGGLLGGAERGVGLAVAAPLEERLGDVDEQAGLAFGDGDRGGVDLAGQVDGGSGVAEGDGDVDLVQLRVDWAEGGAAQVRVGAEAAGGAGGFGEHLVGGGAVVVLGGSQSATQQHRAVHR